MPQDRDPDRDRQGGTGKGQGHGRRQWAVVEHEVPHPHERQRQREAGRSPDEPQQLQPSRPGRALEPGAHREHRAEEEQDGEDQAGDPEHRRDRFRQPGQRWVPAVVGLAEPGHVARGPDEERGDSGEPADHPAAPPWRQGVTVGDEVRDDDQPEEEEDPGARGELVDHHRRAGRAGALGEEQRAETDPLGHQQPADASLRRTQQHHEPDEHGNPGREENGDVIHPASVEPARVVRNGARELFPGRAGHLARVLGPPGRPSSCSSQGHRAPLEREGTNDVCHLREADAVERRRRGTLLGCARRPAPHLHHDPPGGASTQVIRDHLGLNYGSQACLVVMGVALLCFATAVRTLLRSGEGRESTYSSVAFGGWLVVVAGLSQMVMWNWGLINGAADASDDSAVRTLGYVSYFGWAGMGIGLAAAFLAMGLGGIRTAVLPKWFAILTLVLGVLGALGDAGIPPGGLVNYVLLPFWLIAASIVVARSTKRAADPTRQALVTAQEPR